MNKILLIPIIGVAAIIVFALYFNTQNTTPPNERFIESIIGHSPYLANNKTPTFRVSRISKHDDEWYVAYIRPTKEIKKVVEVKVLLKNRNGSLQTVMGPDAYFLEEAFTRYSHPDQIPEAAIKELREQE